MRLAILGATGALGRECTAQALAAGHDVRVLVRTPSKLDDAVRARADVVVGDALDGSTVEDALTGTEGVLFAIGVDKDSPEDLCTDVTRHVLDAMPGANVRRLVWCGGGSNLVDEDVVTVGARFVHVFARTFLGLRHRDKQHQLALLDQRRDVEWVGVRPLQMHDGPRRETYRLGFDAFNGMSRISFADCAHAMLSLLDGDEWLHRAPIIQY